MSHYPGGSDDADDAIRQRLTESGWTCDPSDGVARYESGKARLEVHLRPADGALMVMIFDTAGKQDEIFVAFGDKLDDLLALLSKHRDDLTPETFSNFTAEVKQIWPSAVAFADR